MIPAVGRFVEALREEGLSISPAEVLDAARAVEAVGIEQRSRFRAALRSTLAKGRRQCEIFDRLFDRFFRPPARRAGRGEREREGAGWGGTGGAGSSTGKPMPARAPERKVQSSGFPDEPMRPGRDRRKAPGRESIRRSLDGARSGPRRPEGRRQPARILRADRTGDARGTAANPRRRDLVLSLPTEEERWLARMVPKLVDELRLRKGRRFRRAARGRIWARQIFRENASRGGVPFVLPFRRTRPRRAKVVLLVDVSYSVARASGYFLWMASEFLRPGRDARVIVFVDRPVDATRAIAKWSGRAGGPAPALSTPLAAPRAARGARGGRRGATPGEGIVRAGRSFAELLRSLPGLNLDAPSDYGRTLHALLNSHLRPAGRDTVLLVLGDARSNLIEPLPWALQEIARKCRAVLWLVPEPESRWGSADSVLGEYLPFVDTVVEAKDLDGLARGVGELLKEI